MLYAIKFGSWSKRPHSKKPHPKRPQNFLLPKRPQPKRPHCIWSKRPHKKDHYQNGHTVFGQNGHKGGITTKTATLHLVKMATQGGSLPKRPHCIWSKRPNREDHWTGSPTKGPPYATRVTTKTATLSIPCQAAVMHAGVLARMEGPFL